MKRGRGESSSERFAARVVEFYRTQCRDLPWRHTRDPYAVWVSEIMLQQTRVATVVPYFKRWMTRFPSVQALAAASEDDVLSHWSGLGYYSRARNLKRGAETVCEQFAGRVPAASSELLRIPGIGRYTAGAISSIAFGHSEPLVDGNVARVLARVCTVEKDIKSTAGQKILWQLAAERCPATDAGDYNQGLMELGATICSPKNPSCDRCPVADLCAAQHSGRQHELPRVAKRKKSADKPLLSTTALLSVNRLGVLLAHRQATGLYGGMWELPQAADKDQLPKLVGAAVDFADAPAFEHTQELSHRRLAITVLQGRVRGRFRKSGHGPYVELARVPVSRLSEYGLSSATKRIANTLLVASK